MKHLFFSTVLFILFFSTTTLCDSQKQAAELLESKASNYIRLAEDKLSLANVLHKRGGKHTRLAQKYRKQAHELLDAAQKNLQQAIQLRNSIISSADKRLGELNEKRRHSLRIASWNIQNFGESKMSKIVPYKGKEYTIPEVVADILYEAKFDIVAIQEVEGDNLETIERVVEILNNREGQEAYRLTYPAKMGVSSNTAEFLPIIWDNRLLKLKTQGMLRDLAMQRPPHYALFELRGQQFKTPEPNKSPFDFCLVSVHIAPKGSGEKDIPRRNDFKILPKIFRFLNKKFSTEDIIIAGDFNCDPNRKGIDGELWQNIRKKKIIVHPITLQGQTTVARKTMTYGKRVNDNMIWMNNSEEDWAKIKEVYEYDKLHFRKPDGQIDQNSARAISDHLPVYATFHTGKDTR